MTDARTLQLARAVARYHAGCLRAIGAQNVAQTDVRTAKKAAYPCDLGQLAEVETLLRHGRATITAPARPDEDADPLEHERYQQRLAVWDRVRELAAKAAVESHQKEVIYAGPLLVGVLPRKNTSTNEPVLAPLFLQAVTIAAQPNGSVLITATDEPPRFNTSVWANAFPRTETDQIVTFGIDAQAELADGWDDERVDELLKAIRSAFPQLAAEPVNERLLPWPERPSPAQAAREPSYLTLHPGAALYLANKSSPYLLADLDQIAGDPGRFLADDRPLEILLSPPKATIRPELEHLDIHEVAFPFPSNGPQRRVVDAVDKNRIVVVQGPPGNGKSLTIANLVAHLVAEGKSVLVCSHKEQALTVVRDKLDELKLPFLYASMVGTSAQSKRELQGQIQDVRSFYAKVDQHRLRKQLSEVTDRRRRNGHHYQQLRDDFNHRAEAEQAEAERLLLSIEGIALLPAEDPIVADSDRDDVAHALRRLNDLAREHQSVWRTLLRSPIATETVTGARQAALTRFIELQHARLDAAVDPAVRELVAAWQPAAVRHPERIDTARAAIERITDTLSAPLAELDDDPDPERARTFAQALAADEHLLAETQAAIEQVSGKLAGARELHDARNHLPSELVARRREVLARHGELTSLFRRKAARRWLDENAPGAAGLADEQMSAWVAFWDAWLAVRDTCDALGGELRLEVPERYDPSLVMAYLARLRRAAAAAVAIGTARDIARGEKLRLPVDDVIAVLTTGALERHEDRWRRALDAISADRAGRELRARAELDWVAGMLERAEAAVDEQRYEDARAQLDELARTQVALPGLAERARLLGGPAGQLRAAVAAIEDAAANARPAPQFLRDLDAAFAAQPIVGRLQEIRDALTTRALSDKLGELRDTILSDAKQYLSLRIQQRIYEGFRRPTFTSSLETFRKAISTSAKRFSRIEELKNRADFDVDVLTEVFPCWIMRPEDACRMFPLRRDIFDVVIFDEASQCNPDQTLPIFARAEHAVVFGDEKQLSNEDLKRSLAGDQNKSLLRQSGLTELDRAGLFDQTENSLLGLVSFRDQAPIVLNEHFRCRPELVAFSNTRFYADGLRVMRDAEDDRGLGPAMLIHELQGVPPLGRSKVNPYEARLLVDELCRLLENPDYAGLTIGVLSLFRDQIEYIEGLVERHVPKDVREQRRLICSTVDGFQGDERDVILYSWRYSTSQSPSILAFTNGATGDQRINVALTRARHQAIHFISAPVGEFPGSGNVGTFLQHAQAPERLVHTIESRAHREPVTEARRRAAATLRDAGLHVTEQYVACGAGVDMVVHDPQTWARVAVFIDGEIDPQPPPTADRRVDAQGLLERAGWTVHRILAEEALGDPGRLVGRVRKALARCGPRERPKLDAERHFLWAAEPEPDPREPQADPAQSAAGSVASEDYADYHWPAPSVEARLAAGEDVFQSDFERELYDRLAINEDLRVVPQWRSRGKFIDLVVTDREGRRLAIEADGEQHHETVDGSLIPEDIYRQELLEDVGWVFHRIRHSDFARDPDGEIERLLEHLVHQPANETLATQVWGEDVPPLDSEESFPFTESEPHMDGGSGRFEEGSLATLTEGPFEQTSLIDEQQLFLEEEPQQSSEPPIPAPLDEPAAEPGPSAFGGGGNAREAEPDAGGYAEPGEPLDPETYTGLHLHDVPLVLWPMMISRVVEDRGVLADDQIADAFARRFALEIPHGRKRLIASFTHSAAARKFIARDSDTDDEPWRPGSRPARPIAGMGPWTMNQLQDLVRDLVAEGTDKDDLFDRVVEEVWQDPSQMPRPIARAIGSAIYAVVGRR